MRRFGSVTLTALSVALLSGCAPFGISCPAIGYGSTAYITLDQPRTGVTLEVCDGEGCTPGPAMEPTGVGVTEEPVETGIHQLTGDSSTGWSASMLGGQPVLGYRLVDDTGAVIAEGSVDVEWVRIDGDDRCGGNRAAQVVLSG